MKSLLYFSSSTKKCKRFFFSVVFPYSWNRLVYSERNKHFSSLWFIPGNFSHQNFTIIILLSKYIYLNIYWKMSALLFSEIACTGTYKKVCVRFWSKLAFLTSFSRCYLWYFETICHSVCRASKMDIFRIFPSLRDSWINSCTVQF